MLIGTYSASAMIASISPMVPAPFLFRKSVFSLYKLKYNLLGVR